MNITHKEPADIERTSMRIIGEELAISGKHVSKENEAVVKRVIHTTADFDYADNLHFSKGAVSFCTKKLQSGIDVITDSNMALAGVSKTALTKLHCKAHCYMAHPDIMQRAKTENSTRAMIAMRYATEAHFDAAFAVGKSQRWTLSGSFAPFRLR